MAINNKQFKSLVPFDNGICEVNAGYQSIRLEVPLFIATYVLLSAKKVLTSFLYDFLLKFIPMRSLNLAFSDTDSCYMMFNAPSVIEAVSSDKKEEFLARLQNHCSTTGKQRHPRAVLPRTCCKECALVDSKCPGLWKVRI